MLLKCEKAIKYWNMSFKLYKLRYRQQIIEKRREFNVETHIAFLDLEKAFDRLNRNQLWQILNRRVIPYNLIEVIKSLYKNTS
jgi:hypothetical protein